MHMNRILDELNDKLRAARHEVNLLEAVIGEIQGGTMQTADSGGTPKPPPEPDDGG